jgi:hypothetical protein
MPGGDIRTRRPRSTRHFDHFSRSRSRRPRGQALPYAVPELAELHGWVCAELLGMQDPGGAGRHHRGVLRLAAGIVRRWLASAGEMR